MGSELTKLAEWAEAALPRVTEDVYAAICDRIELYRTDEFVSRDDLHRSVAINLRFIVAAIGDPRARHDVAAPGETGERRARQGVPLPEVLRCYRIGFAMLWDELVDHARHTGRPETRAALLAAAGTIWRLTEEHALVLTEAYRAATADLLVAQQHRRSALVEAVLTGYPGQEGGPWEAGQLLGLPLDAKLAVVAAETRGLAAESLAGIERRLTARGVASAWRLTPALQVGVLSLRAEQCATVLEVLRDAAGARTGVSPLYLSLVDTPRALRLARAALAEIPAGRAEVRMFGPSPLAALIARNPDEGRRLAQQVLGGVLELPVKDRAMLLGTLQAFLDHAGSAEGAAKVLHCHPNTVRYRLRRVHELTGRSLTDLGTLAELATAAYAIPPNPGTSSETTSPPPRSDAQASPGSRNSSNSAWLKPSGVE